MVKMKENLRIFFIKKNFLKINLPLKESFILDQYQNL